MAGQERISKSKSQAKREEVVEEAKKTDSKEELKDEMDDLLDEIDGLLEENAEEFVRNYVLEGRRIDLARTPGRLVTV